MFSAKSSVPGLYPSPPPLAKNSLSKNLTGDLPGGPVVKNLPANTGDTGSIPSPGGFYVPRNNSAHGPQVLSLCSRAQEVSATEPTLSRGCPLQLEKPPQ